MRGSTILLSYAKGSRGLLITPAHPTYEGFYYTVIICQGEQRTINHPSPPPYPLMRGSTILLSYAKGSRGLLITPAHPTYEGFYYTVIICQGEQRTINHPSPPPPPPPLMRGSTILLSYAKGSRGLLSPQPTPPMRGSTILLSYAKGSRGLLITPVPPPPYEGFYYTVIICQGEQRTIITPAHPPPL